MVVVAEHPSPKLTSPVPARTPYKTSCCYRHQACSVHKWTSKAVSRQQTTNKAFRKTKPTASPRQTRQAGSATVTTTNLPPNKIPQRQVNSSFFINDVKNHESGSRLLRPNALPSVCVPANQTPRCQMKPALKCNMLMVVRPSHQQWVLFSCACFFFLYHPNQDRQTRGKRNKKGPSRRNAVAEDR